MLIMDGVCLRPANRKDFHRLWYYIYVDQEWKKLDAPFCAFEYQSKWHFYFNLYQSLKKGDVARVIEVKGEVVGYLTCYWENKETRWLDVGITIFSSKYWGNAIGQRALRLWISFIFKKTAHLARIGLTTWSGNLRMMKCAERIGMRLEGRIRSVRYYQGEYYDSLHYGVLREEWQENKPDITFHYSKDKVLDLI